MRVAVVAEYYPRAADPVLGVWAHRQALAARDAGADVRVLVLHRPVPSRAALKERRGLLEPLRQPLRTELDGIEVTYVPFVAPPRPRTYQHWGAWAAPTLALALRRLDVDLVHAHYAAPAGDAVRHARPGVPLVISVHGGDVLSVVHRPRGEAIVRRALESARARARQLGRHRGARPRARRRQHARRAPRHRRPAHAAPRAARCRRSSPSATSSPASATPTSCARCGCCATTTPTCAGSWSATARSGRRSSAWRRSSASTRRVEFKGELPPDQVRQPATVFALPSIDEAFGVAYVEAMAAGIPAIGCRGEAGPEEIRASGGGIRLVAPGDPESLAEELRRLLEDAAWRRELGEAARATVERSFTWEACGRATVAAYEEALR